MRTQNNMRCSTLSYQKSAESAERSPVVSSRHSGECVLCDKRTFFGEKKVCIKAAWEVFVWAWNRQCRAIQREKKFSGRRCVAAHSIFGVGAVCAAFAFFFLWPGQAEQVPR